MIPWLDNLLGGNSNQGGILGGYLSPEVAPQSDQQASEQANGLPASMRGDEFLWRGGDQSRQPGGLPIPMLWPWTTLLGGVRPAASTVSTAAAGPGELSASPSVPAPAQPASPGSTPPIPRPRPQMQTGPQVAQPPGTGPGSPAQPTSVPSNYGIGRAPDQSNPLTMLLSGIDNGVAGLLGQSGLGTAPQGPGLLGRLTAGANNLTTGGNPIAGIVNAMNGLVTGQRTDAAGVALARQEATTRALMNAGYDATTARAAAINPDLLKALIMARSGGQSPRQQPSAAVQPRRGPAPPNPRGGN
jgi:hypothetical protein